MSVDETLANLVEQLGVAHRARAAYRALLASGLSALPVVLGGLEHDSGAVRSACTRLMDRLARSESFDTLITLCADPEPSVRIHALHALACDRCKAEDVCLLDADHILRVAIDALRFDPDALTRAMAVEVVGRYAHTHADAVTALIRARTTDSNPTVRKKAGWFAPGGVRYVKTAPKPQRAARRVS